MNQASHEIAEFKAVEDDPEGLFAARVSVIGNVDRNGDRIMPGAWDNTKAAWVASGKKVPVIWSHEHKDPNAYIGWVDPNDIRIDGNDIIMAGKLDVKGNPLALRAFNLLKQGLVSDWSFAYKVNTEKVGKDGAREIFDLDLFEVGPTLIGANGMTGTLNVASADLTPEKIAEAYDVPIELVTTQADDVGMKLGTAVDEAMVALDAELESLIEKKIGRVISRRTATKIRDAVAQLNELLSSIDEEDVLPAVEGSPSEEKAVEDPAPPSEDELRKRRMDQLGIFLAERGRE